MDYRIIQTNQSDNPVLLNGYHLKQSTKTLRYTGLSILNPFEDFQTLQYRNLILSMLLAGANKQNEFLNYLNINKAQPIPILTTATDATIDTIDYYHKIKIIVVIFK